MADKGRCAQRCMLSTIRLEQSSPYHIRRQMLRGCHLSSPKAWHPPNPPGRDAAFNIYHLLFFLTCWLRGKKEGFKERSLKAKAATTPHAPRPDAWVFSVACQSQSRPPPSSAGSMPRRRRRSAPAAERPWHEAVPAIVCLAHVTPSVRSQPSMPASTCGWSWRSAMGSSDRPAPFGHSTSVGFAG